MDRRDFLKTGAALALMGAATKVIGQVQTDKVESAAKAVSADGMPDIVAVRGGLPVPMFDRAMAELGGMGKFVKKGQVVTVKPNIAWDQPPAMAANTNPELIARIVRACFEAGASKVQVFDTPCNFWKNTYKNSGIAEAAEKAGATVVGGDAAKDEKYIHDYYVETPVPKGRLLQKVMLHKFIKECDVLINVPILKVHGGATMTCCMKNLMGTVSKEYHQLFHRTGLTRCIAECASVRPPDLNIVDAYRVMTKRGPRGVDETDVKELKYLMVGKDLVALDTAAAKLLQLPVRKIEYLAEGVDLGLGTTNLESLNIKRVVLS